MKCSKCGNTPIVTNIKMGVISYKCNKCNIYYERRFSFDQWVKYIEESKEHIFEGIVNTYDRYKWIKGMVA